MRCVWFFTGDLGWHASLATTCHAIDVFRLGFAAMGRKSCFTRPFLVGLSCWQVAYNQYSGNQTWLAGKWTIYNIYRLCDLPIKTSIQFGDFPASHVWLAEGNHGRHHPLLGGYNSPRDFQQPRFSQICWGSVANEGRLGPKQWVSFVPWNLLVVISESHQP